MTRNRSDGEGGEAGAGEESDDEDNEGPRRGPKSKVIIIKDAKGILVKKEDQEWKMGNMEDSAYFLFLGCVGS